MEIWIIIKIIKSIESSGAIIEGVFETIKYEIKKEQEGRFLGALLVPLAASSLQRVISSVVRVWSERGGFKITNYFNYELSSPDGVSLRNNSPLIEQKMELMTYIVMTKQVKKHIEWIYYVQIFCIAFIEYILAGKNLLDHTFFFLWITIKRMTK